MRLEEILFVFLQVSLITGRQSLHGGEKRDEASVNPASLAANQLPRVGILLLRHQAAAGGKFIGQLDKPEFG